MYLFPSQCFLSNFVIDLHLLTNSYTMLICANLTWNWFVLKTSKFIRIMLKKAMLIHRLPTGLKTVWNLLTFKFDQSFFFVFFFKLKYNQRYLFSNEDQQAVVVAAWQKQDENEKKKNKIKIIRSFRNQSRKFVGRDIKTREVGRQKTTTNLIVKILFVIFILRWKTCYWRIRLPNDVRTYNNYMDNIDTFF